MSALSQAGVLICVFAGAALLLRRRLPCGEEDRLTRGDLALGLTVALLVGALATFWFGPLQSGMTWGVRASDFGEHCQAVVLAAEDIAHPHISANRSRISAWLVSLAGEGPLDAFLTTAALSYVVLAGALFAWGRTLHSRLAGVTTALLSLALGPLVQLARTLSFYPLFAASFVVAAACVAWLARSRNAAVAGLCGVALGGIMLLGLRSLAWFLPLTVAATLLCLGRPWRRVPLRLVALALPIVLSFQLGTVAYSEDARSLERLVNPSMRYNDMGIEGFEARYSGTTHFVWGRTPLADLPGSVRTLATGVRPPMEVLWPHVRQGFGYYVLPWAPVLLSGLLAAFVALRGRPRRVLALGATVAPFLLSGWGSALMHVEPDRFVATAMPAVALAGGLGLASIVQGAPGKASALRPWWMGWVGAVALCVFGVVPSFLAPDASWRRVDPYPPGQMEVACYLHTAAGGDGVCLRLANPHSPQCLSALTEELDAGGTFWPVNAELAP